MLVYLSENLLLVMVFLYAFYVHMPKNSFTKTCLAMLPMYVNYAVLSVVQVVTSKVLKEELGQLVYDVFLLDYLFKFLRLLNFVGLFSNYFSNLAFFRAIRRHHT